MPDNRSVEDLHEERRNTLKDLGERVRRKREDLGLTLRDVHQRTRIRLSFLEGREGRVWGFSSISIKGSQTYLDDRRGGALGGVLPLKRRHDRMCPNHMTIGACGFARGFRQASKFWLSPSSLCMAGTPGTYGSPGP